MRLATYVSLVFAVLAASPHAQERAFSGSWSVRAEAVSGKTEDGGTWNRAAINGTLEIQQEGATLKGAWKGPSGKAWPFTGRARGDKFELTTEKKDMPATINGREMTAPVRWTFRGSVTGNKMSGTMALERVEQKRETLQPFTAERKR